MENNPMIPSNYATLSQLQERWLKQKKDQRKPKEKELPHNEEIQPNIEPPKLKESPQNHTTASNRSFTKTFSAEVPSVCAVSVVEGNERTEITADETNSLDLGVNFKKKKLRWLEKKEKEKERKKKMREKKKMIKKKNQEEKEKTMEDGGTRRTLGEEEEEEVMVRETHAPPANSEKKNTSARRFARKKDMGFDFRPKNTGSVEKSDHTVEIEAEVQDVTGKSDLAAEMEAEVQYVTEKSDHTVEMEAEVQDVTEKSEDTVEIDSKLGDLCIEAGSDRSATQNNTSNQRNSDCTGHNTFNHSSSGFRSRDRIDNHSYRTNSRRRNSDYTGQNGVSDRRSTEYRGRSGGGGGGYGRYRHYRESSERFNGNGMVWVKKGEVAVGTEDA